MRPALLVTALLSVTACAPRVALREPAPSTMTADSVVAATRTTVRAIRRSLAGERDSITAVVVRECELATDGCQALASGSLTLGMSSAQALLVTGTTPSAWAITRTFRTTLYKPATDAARVRDADNAEVTWMRFDGGRLVAVGTREADGPTEGELPTGVGKTGKPLTPAERKVVRLIKDGDVALAAGKYALAAERYGQAHALDRDNPLVTYRLARALDMAQRYPEAARRYSQFVETAQSTPSGASTAHRKGLGEQLDQQLQDAQRRIYSIRGIINSLPQR